MALAFLLSAGLGYAQDEPIPPEKAPDEPDHLVPLNPYPARWHTRYMKLCQRKLKLPAGPEAAVMVYRPAFDPEECLVIHESGGEKPAYRLIHTKADRNIWYSMPENSDEGERERVKVARRECPMPPELAERVCRVWDRMLRGVRYPIPDEEPGGADGVTIEFWRHRMYGKAWSPEGGAPRLFVDLGRSLIDLCGAAEGERGKAQRDVEERCRVLERYLDERGAG